MRAFDGSYWTPRRGGIDEIEDLQEDVLRLREFGLLPGSVLVMILQTEHDVAAFGVLERAV
jgi:hypothetical protein